MSTVPPLSSQTPQPPQRPVPGHRMRARESAAMRQPPTAAPPLGATQTGQPLITPAQAMGTVAAVSLPLPPRPATPSSSDSPETAVPNFAAGEHPQPQQPPIQVAAPPPLSSAPPKASTYPPQAASWPQQPRQPAVRMEHLGATQNLVNALLNQQTAMAVSAGFFLVVVPDAAPAYQEEFATIEQLIAAIRGFLAQNPKPRVFPFMGSKLGISRGPHRYLTTPYGPLPLFALPDIGSLELEESGSLDDPEADELFVSQTEAPLRPAPRAASAPQQPYVGQDDSVIPPSA